MGKPRRRDGAVRVVVAVLTYRRPAELARVLPELIAQAAGVSAQAGVLVVDNDPSGGAAALVARFPGATYVHEPRPGIAAARNRALDEAEARGADALVFIDDDEVPGDRWLALLVDGWQRWHCAAVSGPVVSTFAGPVDPWVTASGAFEPRVRATGAAVPGAATNNLLLDLAAVRTFGLRFDESLGISGGEDTMFTHELVDRGGEIRWCADARVVEPVPPERATRRWVLRRAYRAGTSWSAMELRLAGTPRRRAVRRISLVGRGVVKTGLGAAAWLFGLVTGDLSRRARGAVTVTSYCGLLSGAFGATLAEYRRHARPDRRPMGR